MTHPRYRQRLARVGTHNMRSAGVPPLLFVICCLWPAAAALRLSTAISRTDLLKHASAACFAAPFAAPAFAAVLVSSQAKGLCSPEMWPSLFCCRGYPHAALDCLALWQDDDDDLLNDDDEIPDVRSGGPPKKKGGAPPPGPATEASGKAAFASIVAARQALEPVKAQIANADYAGASKATAKAPLADLESTLLVLVKSPVLGPEEKKSIGTIKRYGVGADVLIMMGGLDAALSSKNAADADKMANKAAQALDEVVLIGKSSGLKP